MEMSDQYGMADLRHLMNGRPHFSSVPPPQPPTADLFSGHSGSLAPPTTSPHFEMLMMGSQIMPSPHPHHFTPDYPPAAAATEISTAAMDLSCGGEGGTGRWPRQETLTLLEIRSRLDFKFKEANHKGPLWDEISRIMCEENGYQRSGKKCREKFENLYKYYKKTKEGKAGRQDGKHYRFFRQLEALYGGDSTSASAGGISHHPYIHTPTAAAAAAAAAEPSLSLSSSFDQLDTSSSDESGTAEKGIRKRRRSWKTKVTEFIDSQMRRLMEKQEQWLEKMLATLEHKERERMARDEEWRNRETARMEKESELWANERAWIKARDAALFEALQKLSGDGQRDQEPMVPPEAQNDAANRNDSSSSSPPPPSNPNRNPNPNGVVVHDGCFRFLMADGRDNLWENYELKDENR